MAPSTTASGPADAIIASHDDTDRKPLHVVVCRSSAEGLRSFCRRNGITVTAFIDAMGHRLPNAEAEAGLLTTVLAARLIDSERRTRGSS